VKKPFLVQRAAGRKSGDGLGVRLELQMIALRGQHVTMPLRISPSRWKKRLVAGIDPGCHFERRRRFDEFRDNACTDQEAAHKSTGSAIIGSSLKIDARSCEQRISKELRQTL
jgi:hypothetical protein